MFVVDFMHEIELGVWKAVFKCLINILNAASAGGRHVTDLDARLFGPWFSCSDHADGTIQIQADSNVRPRHHS
jgi:hypothetical protein